MGHKWACTVTAFHRTTPCSSPPSSSKERLRRSSSMRRRGCPDRLERTYRRSNPSPRCRERAARDMGLALHHNGGSVRCMSPSNNPSATHTPRRWFGTWSALRRIPYCHNHPNSSRRRRCTRCQPSRRPRSCNDAAPSTLASSTLAGCRIEHQAVCSSRGM